MGTRTFPGSRIGLANTRTNIQNFKDYVEAYFDDVEGIILINLSYSPDYSANVIAVSDGGQSVTRNLPISRHELREMLAGTTRELKVIQIQWTNITISFSYTGLAEVIVSW